MCLDYYWFAFGTHKQERKISTPSAAQMHFVALENVCQR
ncbi:hypothetical protein F652_2903 [Enterobacteriaceae bacterium bta3-1]|nr:hypothetical protein F652_2903 [Enterobacteriaceae bacterium bta3-1]